MEFDQATIDTLKDSLVEKDEKREFLGTIVVAISHLSSEPAVTYRGLRLESVKAFFLGTMFDKDPADGWNAEISFQSGGTV